MTEFIYSIFTSLVIYLWNTTKLDEFRKKFYLFRINYSGYLNVKVAELSKCLIDKLLMSSLQGSSHALIETDGLWVIWS
jgi:hypothetical protein